MAGQDKSPFATASPEVGNEEVESNALAPQIWKSRIGWRITLTVFIVTMLVQGPLFYNAIQNFEATRLAELRELGRATVMQHLSKKPEDAALPISREGVQRMISTTPIKGLTIYTLDHNVIAIYGEAATLRSQAITHGQTSYRSVDLNSYEVNYTAGEIEVPYNIITSIDSSHVQPAVTLYMKETIIIFLLMAALVTTILMLAMGQWLLQPMLILRKNLISASQDPKNVIIQGAGKEGRDEIGITLRVANNLIRQNAAHMQQLEYQAAEKIHRLAYYDALTGLPNRTLFLEKLEENIKKKVKGEGKRLIVFSVDIDHFSDLNTTMGHEVGDKLLEAVGKRLADASLPGSIVARSSADEFLIMAVLNNADEDGTLPLENILKALADPVFIFKEEFQVRVSIGVACCPRDGKDSRQILKSADIALNRAKSEGRNTVRFYSEDLDLFVHKRFQLLGDLRAALDNGNLMLHYHPQFDLKTGSMIGAEALLRWWHPDNSPEGGHLVPPEEFVQIAEQTGLMIPIGEWVLRTACQTNKAWLAKSGPALCISVNISGSQFHCTGFVETVDRILQETGLEARYLELEVKESVFMEDMDSSIEILRQLHELGVRLSIDDFGTGYSSLGYLRQFPVDRLKIDSSFTRNALINSSDAAIVRAIITLGHSLGIKVVAEGVETNYHVTFLQEEGCDEAQGYKYTQPLPADSFWSYAFNYNRELLRSNLQVIQETAS